MDYKTIIDGGGNGSRLGKQAICRNILPDLDAYEFLQYYKNQLLQKQKGSISHFSHLKIETLHTKEQLIGHFCHNPYISNTGPNCY